MARKSPSNAKSSARSSQKKRKTHPKRTGIVWTVFAAAMTLAGGALVLTDGIGGNRAGAQGPQPLVSIAAVGDSTAATSASTDTQRSPSWLQIVVHESGSLVGTLDDMSRQHAAVGLPSLGYHFVIGNGNGEQDGAVLTGPRWNTQERGTHLAFGLGDGASATVQAFENPNAIEICLVADTARRPLTDTQVESLASLVRQLARHYGIAATNVVRQQDRGGPQSFASDADWSRVLQRLAN